MTEAEVETMEGRFLEFGFGFGFGGGERDILEAEAGSEGIAMGISRGEGECEGEARYGRWFWVFGFQDARSLMGGCNSDPAHTCRRAI